MKIEEKDILVRADNSEGSFQFIFARHNLI